MPTLPFFDANVLVGRVSRPLPTMVHEPDDILAELARHGVHEALIGHSHAVERGGDGNADAVVVAKGRPGVRPVWVIPQHSAVDIPDPDAFVGDLLSADVAAVRTAPAPYHGHLVAEWALGPVWRRLEEARVPMLLAGSDLGRYPDAPSLGYSAANVHDICRTYPNLPVVVLRTNFSAFRVLVPLMRECPNLHAEISFFTVHRGIEVLAGLVGADRLIFGSGMPYGPPGPAVVATTYAKIPDADKALVAGDNLRRLMDGAKR